MPAPDPPPPPHTPPRYDKAISAFVKDTIGPMINAYKPPGIINKIGFKEVTFGDAPFRIEGRGQQEARGYLAVCVAGTGGGGWCLACAPCMCVPCQLRGARTPRRLMPCMCG